MLRLILLVFGILGASLHGASWAGENVRVFASELRAFEGRQVPRTGPPVKYSDAVDGAELRKLLDPARALVIVGEYFEEIGKQPELISPELQNLMYPFRVRYIKAFSENPRDYEEEYLDTLNWTILLAQRTFAISSLPPMPAAAASSEEQVAMHPVFENLKRLSNSLMRSQARIIRDYVDQGMFSEAGAKRALEIADRVESVTPDDVRSRRK